MVCRCQASESDKEFPHVLLILVLGPLFHEVKEFCNGVCLCLP